MWWLRDAIHGAKGTGGGGCDMEELLSLAWGWPLIPNGTHAQVLAWRKAGGAAAAKLWADLGAANGRVEGAFAALHKAAAAAATGSGAEYDTELQACASNTADKVLAK